MGSKSISDSNNVHYLLSIRIISAVNWMSNLKILLEIDRVKIIVSSLVIKYRQKIGIN